ncbi:MAG: hypothetical protein GXO77_07905 [Calditrichaeota bacterium]|nr:hypothetical protein [Calditrichota bacterium]
MPERILKEIKKIESVEFVAISSYKGEVGFKTGSYISDTVLKQVTIHLIRTFSACKIQGHKLMNMELYWRDRFIIARYAEGFLIFTLCRSLEAMSLLRITLNVTVANLLDNKRFLKWLKKQSYDPLRHLRHGQFDDDEIRLISKVR